MTSSGYNCGCGMCGRTMLNSHKLALRWLNQFNIGPSRRDNMVKRLVSVMEQMEREARTEYASEILDVPINTYWFQKQHNRKPLPHEKRPWRVEVDFRDGLTAVGSLIYQTPDTMAYEDVVRGVREQIANKYRLMEGKAVSIIITV